MNIDKIKNALGVNLFNFIGSLNKEQLEKMKKDLLCDIANFSNLYDSVTKYNRNCELMLINSRLPKS